MHTIIIKLRIIKYPLVDLNWPRPELSCSSNTINSCQISSRWVNDSSQGKTIAEGSSVEWEQRRESDLSSFSIDVDILELGNYWGILLVDVDELKTGAVGLPGGIETALGNLEAEIDGLGLRLDIAGAGLDGQDTEDF